MTVTPYYLRMHQGTGVRVRALLNDLPFYTGDGSETHTVTGPANHLLVPGRNTFTLEVDDAPKPESAPYLVGVVRFALLLDVDVESVVHAVSWPELWDAEQTPEAARTLPLVHTSTFLADPALGKPPYWDAPPAEFGPEGTPAQHAAVREVYKAYLSGDPDAFMAVNRLKLEERQAAYPDVPELSTALQRRKMAEQLGKPWAVRPVDLDRFGELVFERRAGGRVAYVTRKDGYALEAVRQDDPSETFGTNLFLTQRDGAWRVFR